MTTETKTIARTNQSLNAAEAACLQYLQQNGGEMEFFQFTRFCDEKSVNPAGLWHDGLVKGTTIYGDVQKITTAGRSALSAWEAEQEKQ